VRSALLALVCLAGVSAVGSVVAAAQSATAQISGTVVDAAGDVLPGAAVALESVGSGAPRPDAPDVPVGRVVASMVSDETGRFEFTASAGIYTL
jgi:type 1 fimbria pilin